MDQPHVCCLWLWSNYQVTGFDQGGWAAHMLCHIIFGCVALLSCIALLADLLVVCPSKDPQTFFVEVLKAFVLIDKHAGDRTHPPNKNSNSM